MHLSQNTKLMNDEAFHILRQLSLTQDVTQDDGEHGVGDIRKQEGEQRKYMLRST